MINRRDPLTEYDDGTRRRRGRPYTDPTDRSLEPRSNPDSLADGPYRNLVAAIIKIMVDDLLNSDPTLRTHARHWVESSSLDELASWLGYPAEPWRQQLYADGKMEQRPVGTKRHSRRR